MLFLRKRGIRPQIQNEFGKTKKNRGRPIKISVPRYQQERCFAWFQRKYRRLVVRWERQKVYFDALINIATIHIWIQRILLVDRFLGFKRILVILLLRLADSTLLKNQEKIWLKD